MLRLQVSALKETLSLQHLERDTVTAAVGLGWLRPRFPSFSELSDTCGRSYAVPLLQAAPTVSIGCWQPVTVHGLCVAILVCLYTIWRCHTVTLCVWMLCMTLPECKSF